MTILILGLILFLGVHSVRVFAPSVRDGLVTRFGEGPYKGLYSLVALAGFVLLVWGFARASEDSAVIYVPPFSLRHATEGLMLVALVLAVASVLPPGRIKRWVRHPLLIGTVIWAASHLFVNGDAAAVVLFGAFLAWALLDLARQSWAPVRAASPASDIIAVVVGVGLYLVLVWRLHLWLFGVSPIV